MGSSRRTNCDRGRDLWPLTSLPWWGECSKAICWSKASSVHSFIPPSIHPPVRYSAFSPLFSCFCTPLLSHLHYVPVGDWSSLGKQQLREKSVTQIWRWFLKTESVQAEWWAKLLQKAIIYNTMLIVQQLKGCMEACIPITGRGLGGLGGKTIAQKTLGLQWWPLILQVPPDWPTLSGKPLNSTFPQERGMRLHMKQMTKWKIMSEVTINILVNRKYYRK